MKKKYELTNETKVIMGRKVFRIRALRDFNDVKKGDLGGWVESENNLSHDGNCWLYDDAVNIENSRRIENAIGSGEAISSGNSMQTGNSHQAGNSRQFGNSMQTGNSHQAGNSRQFGYSQQFGNSRQAGNVITIACHNSGELSSNDDFIEFTNCGDYNRCIMYVFKTKKININNCFIGTVDELEESVKRKYKNGCLSYERVIKIIRLLESDTKDI